MGWGKYKKKEKKLSRIKEEKKKSAQKQRNLAEAITATELAKQSGSAAYVLNGKVVTLSFFD